MLMMDWFFVGQERITFRTWRNVLLLFLPNSALNGRWFDFVSCIEKSHVMAVDLTPNETEGGTLFPIVVRNRENYCHRFSHARECPHKNQKFNSNHHFENVTQSGMTYPNKLWDYLPVLNECIKILLTVVAGGLMGHLRVFDAKTFVPQATKFVFYVALPMLVIKGLGIGIDFYDDSFLWTFIGAFLILRVIALVISLAIVLGRHDKQKGIGEIAVMWLSLTWISTVILGVPISGAVFGDPKKGLRYGILSGISSFIFQLPLQLFILECHLLEQEYLNRGRTMASVDVENQSRHSTNHDSVEPGTSSPSPEQTPQEGSSLVEKQPSADDEQHTEDERQSPFATWRKLVKNREIWKNIGEKVLRNPVIWGILIGFALSLSTVGPKYLLPTSDEHVHGLGWIFITLGWFGDCVSPVSLFAMGLWAQSQGTNLFQVSLHSMALFMLSKLVLVPLIMVGLAKALDLNDEAGRAAVLIAALPISMASFSLGSRYKIGEAVLSENVALGTALVLPTILIWNIVMDALDLFPVPS